MIALRKAMMIILNGLHKNLSKLIFIFIILLICSANSEEIKLAPLINLDEIEPSYDEELISNQFENLFHKNKQKDNDINAENEYMAEISILNKITTNVDRVKISLKENYFYQ